MAQAVGSFASDPMLGDNWDTINVSFYSDGKDHSNFQTFAGG
jgi:hypothetical protein